MPAHVILGAQWGDEGVAQIVDALAVGVSAVVRVSGEGETSLSLDGHEHPLPLRVAPSGIATKGVDCLVGPGSLIDAEAAISELKALECYGLSTARLWLDRRAQLIMPYHAALDVLGPTAGLRGMSAARGVGPAHASQRTRLGLRLGDLEDPGWLRLRLQQCLKAVNQQLGALGGNPAELEVLFAQCRRWGEALSGRIRDTSTLIAEHLRRGGEVLVEGVAAMADIDHGPYPFVGASVISAAGLCHNGAVPPMEVEQVLAVIRPISVMLGSDPMVSELDDEAGEALQRALRREGDRSTAGKRCGWLDLVALRTGALINGFTGLAVSRLDHLDRFDQVGLCTAYQAGGTTYERLPSTAALLQAQPVIETLEGWSTETGGCRSFAELPRQAKAFLERVSDELGVPVRYVSVGPTRADVIRA